MNLKKFLKMIVLISLVLVCYALFIEKNIIQTKKITIKVNDTIPEYKIAFFSDTHFGKYYNQKNIKRIVKKINEQNVDVVIFGGDFFDNYNEDQQLLDINYIIDNLSKINAKYGKFAVYGNHDFGGGARIIYDDIMNLSGFHVLANESIFIDELNTRIIGFEDAIFGQVVYDYYNIKSKNFNIIVSHEPDIIDVINMENDGIMLSGHTHGGQIYIPFITNKILPPFGKKYKKGIYENMSINQNVLLYVSKGLGTTFIPIRFLNPPEICILSLKH